MDKIKKIKLENPKNSKVLVSLERKKELSRIKRFKKWDEVIYNDCRYIIQQWEVLKEKGISYELIDKDTLKRVKNTPLLIKENLFKVNQKELIQYDLEERLWIAYDVKALDCWHCYYDIRSTTSLKAKNEEEYIKKENLLEKYEIKKKDYKIWFMYDVGGYEYWKEHNFDNIIQLTLDIKNYQFDIADLTSDLRSIINKVEILDV